MREYDRAIADYTEAIRIKPDLAETFYNRGYTYAEKGEHDRAIPDYTEAIRIKSDFAEAYYNRGVAHEKPGDHDRAAVDYAKAHKLDTASGFTAACAENRRPEPRNALWARKTGPTEVIAGQGRGKRPRLACRTRLR